MQRSIRRQIIKETTGDWAGFQQARYGESYDRATKSGVRTRHYHHNPVADKHAAKAIGFRAVLRNFFAKITRKTETRRREATV